MRAVEFSFVDMWYAVRIGQYMADKCRAAAMWASHEYLHWDSLQWDRQPIQVITGKKCGGR